MIHPMTRELGHDDLYIDRTFVWAVKRGETFRSSRKDAKWV